MSYKLSEFAKSLPEIEFKFYCEKIEEMKCNDPLVIDLHLFKSGSDLKKLIPPITRDHLIVYLIVERRGSDKEKVEAVNNFFVSEQYCIVQCTTLSGPVFSLLTKVEFIKPCIERSICKLQSATFSFSMLPSHCCSELDCVSDKNYKVMRIIIS